VQTYTRRGALPTRTRTFWRFGSKRRFVATIEWLRLLPKAGPFPQLMHTLAMRPGVYRPTPWGSVQTMPATEQRVSLPPRYRVVRHIANGGMASVWAAEDELLGRLVAVKLLARAYDADERARKRFLREARAAAKLGDCRHVVTVYDIGEHDDRAFIVMEHFAGGSLADRLRTGAPIPRPLALRWLREAAIALDCAHEHDVVHRDVKPANLLLDGRGRLAVGDFGIATVASEASVTLTGQVLGTAAYISPEQARGNPATAASDRYALAVVAYELLTGRRPFAADHPAAQARQHVEATVPAASAAASGLPKAVDAVLAAGLAKDPSDRPATAAELVERLEDALGGDAEPADPPTAATQAFTPVAAPPPARRREPRVQRPATPPPARPRGTTSSRPVPPPRRSWGWLAALAALLLAAGAVAAIAMTSGGSGGSGDGSDRAAERTTSRSGTATSERRRTQSTQSTPAASTPAQGTSSTPRTASTASTPRAPASADPKQLNDRGFAMLQQGDAAGAVQPLQQSVAAFRSQGRRGEIDYAFALYNLGNALRRSGKPGDAIPFLEERLKVSDYKRGVVQRELALARQQAGQGGSGAAAPAAAQPGKAAKAPRAERKDNSGPGNADDGGGDD
jgi:eukaryotic-like serine/threonine-protein kinase